MTSSNKRLKQSSHNQREKNPIVISNLFLSIHLDTSDTAQTVNNNDLNDLFVDYSFIAPYEICSSSIGLMSVLMYRHIIDIDVSICDSSAGSKMDGPLRSAEARVV